MSGFEVPAGSTRGRGWEQGLFQSIAHFWRHRNDVTQKRGTEIYSPSLESSLPRVSPITPSSIVSLHTRLASPTQTLLRLVHPLLSFQPFLVKRIQENLLALNLLNTLLKLLKLTYFLCGWCDHPSRRIQLTSRKSGLGLFSFTLPVHVCQITLGFELSSTHEF